jgi:hydroxymethylpyrimidine/phosphomethylpyrimidine kinase
MGIMHNHPPRILIIAGSDSGGGAGIQADIKTVAAFGGYGMTAITALTAQNTQGVSGIHPVPAAFVAQQMRTVLSDIGAEAMKTGMLLNAEIIEAVAEVLSSSSAGGGEIPLILDPVMVAKGGAALLEPAAIAALRSHLIPRATLLTPNLPEASLLIGQPIETRDDMEAAIPALRALGSAAVLLKGGHLTGDTVTDMLITAAEIHRFSSPRIISCNTHGTGCTLASAMATLVGKGVPLPEAVAEARAYVARAMEAAPGFGQGHGPLWHGVGR